MDPATCRQNWPLTPTFVVDKSKSSPKLKNKQACTVPGCQSSAKARGVRYPKDETLCQQWLDSVQNGFTYIEVKELALRVCLLHFHENELYAINNGLAFKVKNYVIPSLNLPPFVRQEEALAQVPIQTGKTSFLSVLLQRV